MLGLAIIYVVASAYGSARWRATTRRLRERLNADHFPVRQPKVDFSKLKALPPPVQRYFRTVLTDGQPVVTGGHVQHIGTFNMSETAEQWKPFTSRQWVAPYHPGFVWDGQITVLPGLSVRVHDAYVAGEGILHASLLGVISLADLRGEGKLAEGELMRYFAEAVWYPTALLPGQGVQWKAVNDSSAFGTLTDGDVSITLLFTFGKDSLIETVRTEARGRTVSGKIVPTPWYGRFWNYQEQGGMLIPTDGEVAWRLPEGNKPYWRGRITDLDYNFAQPH